MIDIVLAESDASALRKNLTSDEIEGCAILYARECRGHADMFRLLVREVEYPREDDYNYRETFRVELSPGFVARVAKRAHRSGHSIVFVHSHPGDNPPEFSVTDDLGERRIASFLSHRHSARIHASLLISKGGVRARQLGTPIEMRVVSIGNTRDVLFDPLEQRPSASEIHDRQIRAFGVKGQYTLGNLRVGIVGLGGIGSIVAQQLAHLGVRRFLLVDPDSIEATNLNRVSNATAADIGVAKIKVAERYIENVAIDASVTSLQEDVISVHVARRLCEVDLIMCCTDSHGSRAIIQQVAYQYLIPCIDTGTIIVAENGKIKHVSGRIQLLSPGMPCLHCCKVLNSAAIRRDMMTAFERQSDPYIHGANEPAPAVMSINGTVAALSVTMVLSVVLPIPIRGRHLLYDALKSTIRNVSAAPETDCHICSRAGSFAEGDSWPLLGRKD